MINIVWLFLVVSGILYAIFTGNIDAINSEIMTSVKSGIDLVLNILPVLILWMGIMRLALKSGLLDKITRFFAPFLLKLFPTLKKDDLALSYIASNIVANMMGLGSAATPFGLKAMEELQKVNPKEDEASPAMITFLILNTAGVTIIPTTVIALRLMYNSTNPSNIILPSILATFFASLGGLTLDYLIRRKKK